MEVDALLPAKPDDWTLEEHDIVDTTQSLARGRPAWSAVLAQEQRSGRGQRERTFVSDRGGLYLSAVLPYAGDPLRSRGFALAVGWAVREALLGLGVHGVRLRWPNDLMIDARKVGGILVEQAGPRTLVVGIGLNVTNRPWVAAPELREIACSLEEAVAAELPTRRALTEALLSALGSAFTQFEKVGLVGMVARLNASWGEPREVALELCGTQPAARGKFVGITPGGDLELMTLDRTRICVPEHHVVRLREV